MTLTEALDDLSTVNKSLAALKQRQWDMGREVWRLLGESEAASARRAVGWRVGDLVRGYIVDGYSVETRRVVDTTVWRVTSVTGDAVWIEPVDTAGRVGSTWGLLGQARRWFRASDGCFDRVENV